MGKKMDSSDSYRILIFNKILQIAPLTAVGAIFTFTIARLFGYFEHASIPQVVGFDLAVLSYYIYVYIMKKMGITENGQISRKKVIIFDIVLVSLIVLQWNLITYIFPTISFWGFAPMFVLLTSFMFRIEPVLLSIGGLSISIAISWIIKGDLLLPCHDEDFVENILLRIVCLVLSFIVIFFATYYAEKFTKIVKENYGELEKKNKKLENASRELIDFTADIIEERDFTSGAHVKRIKAYTKILAEQVASLFPEYRLSEEVIKNITLACALHDVGKIAIPDSILLKPGKLTSEEFETIKTHTTIGARIVEKLPESIGEDYKRYCKEICKYHHERYDGKGYPSGLIGDEIPIGAQIVAVVDCYDALTNERPYKEAYSHDLAIKMILNGECGAFSEKIRTSIRECEKKFKEVIK